MSEIINIGNQYPPPPVTRSASIIAVAAPANRTLDGDTVEFSRRAEALAQAVVQSSLQLARTRAIRAEIANGTYITPERVAGTVDRLLDVIG